jgi:phosphate ABC transporter, permease protein PstC
MPPASNDTPTPEQAQKPFRVRKERTRFLGLTLDECIQAFFGGNAFVAVIVLALITVFLFREGSAFFGQNRDNLTIYRRAGLEYVDIIRQQEKDHAALSRYLSAIRLATLRHYLDHEKLPNAEAQKQLVDFDDFATRYGDAIEDLRGLASELGEAAVAIKTRHQINLDAGENRRQLLAAGKPDEAASIRIEEIDFEAELALIKDTLPVYEEIASDLGKTLAEVVANPPALPTPELRARIDRFESLNRDYLATFPSTLERLKTWDHRKPVPLTESFTAFIFGRQWLTASFWQDWYGVLPLLSGSLLVSVIALCLAIPLGVGAAIYINQLASPAEQRLIKPTIEFISAIPSVVLGFFGIAVLGEFLRAASGWSWLSWFPGFPFAERLNALTAGCLLGLIAVPTIFTLAEDAINNVPRSFKEASFALGATRLQTIIRIIVPASLSGIVSAILLGLGRVIGETMVVLLCAGNRIAIPDFSTGLGVVTQPVHTMTGIIAQELGEVARGSVHYRALFVVGLLLFFIALTINFCAQKIVRKYKISVG